jgi:hypothetical protein
MDDDNHLVEEKEDETESQQSTTFKSLVSSL